MNEKKPPVSFAAYLILSSLLLCGLGILFFHPVFSSYFRLDDLHFSSFFKPDGGFKPGLVGTFFYPAPEKGGDIFNRLRPFPAISFVLDCFFWGGNPFGFYLTSFLIHIGICLNLTAFSFLLFPKSLKPFALVSGILFLLYPGHLESVCWISARQSEMSTLFCTFTLLSFLAFLLGRRMGHPLALAGLFFALGSKEIAVTLPLILLALHFLQTPWRGVLKTGALRLLRLHAPFWILLGLYLLYRLHLFGTFLGRNVSGPVSLEKLPEYLKFLPASLLRFLAPVNIELVSPAVWWAGTLLLLSITLVIPLIIILSRRKSPHGIEIFCLLWLLLAILPTIPAFRVKANLFENRQFYLPSAPLVTLVTYTLLCPWRIGRIHSLGKFSLLALALLYMAFLRPSVLSYQDVGKTSLKAQRIVIDALRDDPSGTGAVLINLPFEIRGIHFGGPGFQKITSPPFTSQAIPMKSLLSGTNIPLQEIARKMGGRFRVFRWHAGQQTIVPYDYRPGEEKKRIRLIRPGPGTSFSSFGPDFKFLFSYDGNFTVMRIKFFAEKMKQVFTAGKSNLKEIARKGSKFFEWSIAQGALDQENPFSSVPTLSGKTIRWQVEAADESVSPPILIARSSRSSFHISEPAKRGKRSPRAR